jgi:uncharacterized membrane protein YdcZ (DUF606 family)
MFDTEMQELKSLCCSLICLHPKRYPPRPFFLHTNKAFSGEGCCSYLQSIHPQSQLHHLLYEEQWWVWVGGECVALVVVSQQLPAAVDLTCTSPPIVLLIYIDAD